MKVPLYTRQVEPASLPNIKMADVVDPNAYGVGALKQAIGATGELENPEQYITKFGKFLRKTSLDELPQLWNILKGDMSFVGPRPLISSEMRAHRLRLEYGVYRFRPGLTGWAQINGRDSISLLRKMKLDKEYCDNWSLKLDLIILLRSVGAVVKQEGFHEGTYHRR